MDIHMYEYRARGAGVVLTSTSPLESDVYMRAVVEGDLSVTARRVVRKADEVGWYVVGVVSSGAGQGETVLSLRGRRGAGRFVVVFIEGGVEGVFWWTREHSAVVPGYREVEHITQAKHGVNVGKKLVHDPELDEVVTWTTELPVRTKLATLAALVGVAGGKNPRPGLLESEVT